MPAFVDHRGRIEVDENFQTATPGIYAVGDIIGFPALASTLLRDTRTRERGPWPHKRLHLLSFLCHVSVG